MERGISMICGLYIFRLYRGGCWEGGQKGFEGFLIGVGII